MSEAIESGDVPADHEIWIGKYRPQAFGGVYGQDDIVEYLRSYIERDDLPHLLFAGPAGVDKTTFMTAIVRVIYGDDWHGDFLGLNASDERGIDVARDRIKNFACLSLGSHDYRVTFLDEADSLTNDVQSAFRWTMEQFPDSTHLTFPYGCSSKIIDPIQSHHTVFRLSPLGDDAIAERVRNIAAVKDIEATEDDLDAPVYAIGGDMRRVISFLQAAAATGEVVDEEAAYVVTSTIRPEDTEEMVRATIDGELMAARKQLETPVVDTGVAGDGIIGQLYRSAWEFDLDERDTVRFMERIDGVNYHISEGVDEQVRLETLFVSFALSQN